MQNKTSRNENIGNALSSLFLISRSLFFVRSGGRSNARANWPSNAPAMANFRRTPEGKHASAQKEQYYLRWPFGHRHR